MRINEDKTKKGIHYYIILQGVNIVFSITSVITKVASLSWEENGLFHWNTLSFIFLFVTLLAVYAYFWQKIIKKVSLTTAYLNKGMLLFWNLLWAVTIFNERITISNIIGTLIIVFGTMMVNHNE